MTTSVRCSCGVELVVVGRAAGELLECPKCAKPIPVPASPPMVPAPVAKPASAPAQAAPEILCVYCGASISRDAFHCPRCMHQVKSDPHETAVKWKPASGETVPEKRPVPWEIWFIVGLLAVGTALSGVYFNLFCVIVGGLVVVPMFTRTGWGWWVAVVLSIVLGYLHLYQAFTLPWAQRDDPIKTIRLVGAAMAGAQIVLLITSRMRGTYEKD